MWVNHDELERALAVISGRIDELERGLEGMATRGEVDALTAEIGQIEQDLGAVAGTIQAELDPPFAVVDQWTAWQTAWLW